LSDPSAVFDAIYAAFPATRSHRFAPLVNSQLGDEPADVAADFADKQDWTLLDATFLDRSPRGLSSALSFLSDEAVCFYLPAFLVADVRGELERVDPVFYLAHGFDAASQGTRIWPDKTETWTAYATQRWSHLTTPQVRAVVHYCEWRIARGGFDLEHALAEALAFYWYARTAVA
jgi:hypothetical protein